MMILQEDNNQKICKVHLYVTINAALNFSNQIGEMSVNK